MDEDVKQAFEKIDQKFDDVKKLFEVTWTMIEHSAQETRMELRGEISDVRTELKGEIAEMRGELREVRAEVADLRSDIRIVAESVIAIDQKFDRRLTALERRR